MTSAEPEPAVDGTRTFQASADAYDAFMGRYSRELAAPFADCCLPASGGRFLDVGCGPGALTTVAVDRLGAAQVSAVDPTPGFVAACQARHPGVRVRQAPAERLPFEVNEFDAAAAQLVFHFVSDPTRGALEMARVVRPGGVVAAAVWDFAGGMQMLTAFWDVALARNPLAPAESKTLRFGSEGELSTLFADVGLDQVTESTETVVSQYQDFTDLWNGFLAGIGPAGAYALAQPPAERDRLAADLFERIGSPSGQFQLQATARIATARVPSEG